MISLLFLIVSYSSTRFPLLCERTDILLEYAHGKLPFPARLSSLGQFQSGTQTRVSRVQWNVESMRSNFFPHPL